MRLSEFHKHRERALKLLNELRIGTVKYNLKIRHFRQRLVLGGFSLEGLKTNEEEVKSFRAKGRRLLVNQWQEQLTKGQISRERFEELLESLRKEVKEEN